MKEMMVPQREYGSVIQNERLPKKVPILGLGCSSFSCLFNNDDDGSARESLTAETISKDDPRVSTWIEAIRHAICNRGINLLDTAPWYGYGISEIVIGYAMDDLLEPRPGGARPGPPATRARSGHVPRSHILINTKIGRYDADPKAQFDFTYDMTISSVERSLRRMNCDYIDVLQLHDPEFADRDDQTPRYQILFQETIPALLHCRDTLKYARAIGLTGYPLHVQHDILSRCTDLVNAADRRAGVLFDQSLTYCHCNFHDLSLFRDFSFQTSQLPHDHNDHLHNDSKLMSYAQYCQKSQVGLMAAAPLSMGLLTHNGPPLWHPAPPSLKLACRNAANLCSENGVNISALAIVYALSFSFVGEIGVACTLLGMRNVEEVDIAADLAMRFSKMKKEGSDEDYTKQCNDGQRGDGTSTDRLPSILTNVLTPDEQRVLSLLLDESRGPFADVWATDQYRWDGEAEARKFWSSINNAA